MKPRHDDILSRYLAVAYTVLVVYASLHPFSGWRDSGAAVFDFLIAPWPRYVTGFDLTINVLAYLPLGFLWSAAWQRRFSSRSSVLVASLIGIILSLGMETVQNYLPSRVPSNLDLACNSLGALVGALLGARHGQTLLSGGRLHVQRQRWVLAGPAGDAGLILLSLWLLTQLNPETLLFGNGDLRQLLDLEDLSDFDVGRFSRIEAVIAAANTLAVGFMTSCLLQRRQLFLVVILLLGGLAVHTFAHALLISPQEALRWATPGNRSGLLVGILLLLPCLGLPPALRRVMAGSALLFATVLVNLAPTNPYLTQAAQAWWQGHFLNFNGLTRLTSMLWPFLALPWLLMPQRKSWNQT